MFVVLRKTQMNISCMANAKKQLHQGIIAVNMG